MELFMYGISHVGVDTGNTMYNTKSPIKTISKGGMEDKNSPNFIIYSVIIFKFSNLLYQYILNLMRFKIEHTFDQRRQESTRVLSKYPDRIPIICEKANKCRLEEIDKKKYLVPIDLTCGQFVYVIRKRLNLPAEKAIFLFIQGCIPCSSESISNMYERNKDADGFLYIQYSEENVFG